MLVIYDVLSQKRNTQLAVLSRQAAEEMKTLKKAVSMGRPQGVKREDSGKDRRRMGSEIWPKRGTCTLCFGITTSRRRGEVASTYSSKTWVLGFEKNAKGKRRVTDFGEEPDLRGSGGGSGVVETEGT